MQIIRTEKKEYSIKDSEILFDIETTGLSAQSSYVYLIGMIKKENNVPTLIQIFADNFTEEKELISLFLKEIPEGSTLISYNGLTFDIPYINHKMRRYKILHEIDPDTTLDIYKEIRSKKKYFELESLKQTDVEIHAGFERTDTFTGGDLIDVYSEYVGISRLYDITKRDDVKEKRDGLLHVLLLHNHDDLLGLYHILKRSGICYINDTTFDPVPELNEYELSFTFEIPLYPVPFSVNNGLFYFENGRNSSVLALNPLNTTLKYFFEDYKNYTFVIDKGYAMHNSVVSGLEKSNLMKCKKNNAYILKPGLFVPVPKNCTELFLENKIKLFKDDYASKQFYAELSDLSPVITEYAKELLVSL